MPSVEQRLRYWRERAMDAEAKLAQMDKEIERLKNLIDGDDCPDPDKIDALFRRAEAAEAELAQIKAQEPVAFNYWMMQEGGRYYSIFSRYNPPPSPDIRNVTPLYAAPVDQTAEIERLRNAGFSLLSSIDADNELGTPEKFNAYHDLQSALLGREPL